MPINSFLYPGAKTTPAYEVANSCRFNRGDSAYMHKTPSGAGNVDTWTFSAWIKISDEGTHRNIFSQTGGSGTSQRTYILLNSSNDLYISQYDGSSTNFALETNRKFRDQSAWMHIVVAVDTTQGTDSNRIKLYINGTQETSFSTSTYPSQNLDTYVNSTNAMAVGYDTKVSSRHYGGYMAEVVLIDGTQLDATSFGEFDSDSPTIWKPIDVSGLTFGTNGFYLNFEDSSNLGNDVNGGTDLTEVNLAAADQATDTCTNNFCTLNPLYNIEGSYTLSEGNTIFTATGANDGTLGTIAVSSGKWYFEAEFDSVKEACYAGFADVELINNIGTGNPITKFIGQYRDDYAIQIGGSNDGAYTDVANGDIFGFAINLDANSGSKTVVIQKNGTTTDTVTIPTANENNFFIPVVGDTTGGDPSGILKCNFGGSPAVAPSSAVADANGFGSFEYNPTIGGVDYLAICTKNLAEFG